MTAADAPLLADPLSSRLLPDIGGGRSNQHTDGPQHGLIGGLAVAARPNQWVKNAAVLLAPVAAVATLDGRAIFAAAGATAAFCIASSSVYLLNDTVDRDQDRLHPMKRNRPIASGAVSPGQALAAAMVAATSALGIGMFISPAVAAVLALYLVSSAAYSLGLKRIAFLDVAVLAAGFVLRVMAGVAAAGLATPTLLLVATFGGAAFLAFGKRRSELSLLGAEAPAHRVALAGYRLPVLDTAIQDTEVVTVVAFWWWIAAVVAGPLGIALGGLAAAGLLNALETYRRGLTHGHGGNPTHELMSNPALLPGIALTGLIALSAGIVR